MRKTGSMRCFILAAQVAVTTSVADPRTDFAVNALGTFNVLDAVRRHCPEAVFIFASTNKVYGKIAAAACELRGSRYAYVDRPYGIGESEPLDFLSPYGCSKGAADQYALDFARIYEIPATSFRQSCIYGPRQFGVEDQGWLAWFAIASMLGRDITIFGDGKQVRDVLHVDDLLRAYEAAIRAPDKVAQQAFNVGGGPDQTPVFARPGRDAREPARPRNSPAMGRLASRRSAGLRQRHSKARYDSGLEARNRRQGRNCAADGLGGARIATPFKPLERRRETRNCRTAICAHRWSSGMRCASVDAVPPRRHD